MLSRLICRVKNPLRAGINGPNEMTGRWKSSQMPAHYAKAELAERRAIARYKERSTLGQVTARAGVERSEKKKLG